MKTTNQGQLSKLGKREPLLSEEALAAAFLAASGSRVQPVSPRHFVSSGLSIFLLFLIAYAYFLPRWADWNENSHFSLVQSLVEEHRFVIDDYYHWTGDYAMYRGHQYTDKAPGLSFLAVPFFAGFQVAEGLVPANVWTRAAASNSAFLATLRANGSGLLVDKIQYAAGLYVVTFFTVSVPSALLWLFVYMFLGEVGIPGKTRLMVTLLSGLGTLALPYATVFYNHMTAAFLTFAAFYLLFRIKHGRLSPDYLWAVGAILGLTVLTDFPSVIPAGILFLYAASFLPRRVLLARIIGGALPFAIALGFYNAVCFGSPFTSSYRYLALFPDQRSYGFLGFSWPTWAAFWGITFSPFRGLFFSSPFLLAALPGALLGWRDRRWRAELLVAIAVICAYLVLISCYYDWKGGFAVAAPRNLISILPFLAVLSAWGISAAWHSANWRIPLLGTAAWSLMAAFIETTGGQDFAPITIPDPLFQFFLPRLLSGDVNRNLGMVLRLPRWYSLLPLIVLLALLTLTLWAKEKDAVDYSA
jgi:hypothetical protein